MTCSRLEQQVRCLLMKHCPSRSHVPGLPLMCCVWLFDARFLNFRPSILLVQVLRVLYISRLALSKPCTLVTQSTDTLELVSSPQAHVCSTSSCIQGLSRLNNQRDQVALLPEHREGNFSRPAAAAQQASG